MFNDLDDSPKTAAYFSTKANSERVAKRAKLERLLEVAKNHVMTPREIWLQRVSFVYGQMMENPEVTREAVEARATETYGPCPALDLTDEDYDDMFHALGRPKDIDSAYRNYFYIDVGSTAAHRFEKLGVWTKARVVEDAGGVGAYYVVNELGKRVLKQWLTLKQAT